MLTCGIGEAKRTISPFPLEVHAGSKHTFGSNTALQLQLVFWRCVRDQLRLKDEPGVSFLRDRREPCCDFLLGSEQLQRQKIS